MKALLSNKKILFIIIGAVVILAAAAVVLLLLLGGRSKAAEPDPTVPAPTQYQAGEEMVTALSADGAAVTVETDEESGGVTYHYEGVSEPAGSVEDYCALLTAEDLGFTPVDETRTETDLPDFTAEEGSVQLARPVSDTEEGADETVLSLTLTWSGENCTVYVNQMEGSIVLASSGEDTQGLTAVEAVDYLESLPPESLGLTGESMEEYRVYVLDGTVLVGEYTCRRLNVYGDSVPAGTNEIAGQYFLTGDGSRLYRLNADGTVRELMV